MKKQSIFIRAGTIVLSVLMFLGILLVPKESVFAATTITANDWERNYTNSREFYDSFEEGTPRTAFYNGYIWYGTKANKALSTTTRRYKTLGYEIVITDMSGTKSVSINCKRGGAYTEHPGESEGVTQVRTSKTYWDLYRISYNDLIKVAMQTNPEVAAEIFSQSMFNVHIYPIVAERNVSFNSDGSVKNDVTHGKAIETKVEDSSGNILYYKTEFVHNESCCSAYKLWNFKNPDDLAQAKSRFKKSADQFQTWAEMETDLDNYKLTLVYYSDSDTDNSNFELGEISAYRWQQLNLSLPKDFSNFPTKVGYHAGIKNGNNITDHWLLDKDYGDYSKGVYTYKNETNYSVFTGGSKCYPSQLSTIVEQAPAFIALYVNWQPNTYTVKFNGNGATSGSMSEITLTYDDPTSQTIPVIQYEKTGCKFSHWTYVDDAGEVKELREGEPMFNLTAEDGKTVELTAVWESLEHNIALDDQGGTGGSDIIYEIYGKGYFSTSGGSNKITTVNIPVLDAGHKFAGYYVGKDGVGEQVIDANGKILRPGNTGYFNNNMVLYAYYKPLVSTLNFDQGIGSGGTTSVQCTYTKPLPNGLTAPSDANKAYTFIGYFENPMGSADRGTQYYNEYMSPVPGVVCNWIGSKTVYAHWEDNTPPVIKIEAPLNWTNKIPVLNVTAHDTAKSSDTLGIAGLKSITIYRNDEKIYEKTDLNTTNKYLFEYILSHPESTDDNNHKWDGIYTYRVVVVDIEGNEASASATIYYDTVAPNVDVITQDDTDLSDVVIEIYANDSGVQTNALYLIDMYTVEEMTEGAVVKNNTSSPLNDSSPLPEALPITTVVHTNTSENAEEKESGADDKESLTDIQNLKLLETAETANSYTDTTNSTQESIEVSVNTNAPPSNTGQ